MSVPVLLILFNRPNHTRQVMNRLRQVCPAILYVAVDGPRPGHTSDIINIAACKELVNMIDWPCKVQTLFRTENLGCKFAVSSAITWFFDNVEQGIILEDDCLPDITFFDFCAELLVRYQSNEQVMHIGGTNLFAVSEWVKDSYFFSKICHVWGWATWRRAWQLYDVSMKEWVTDNKTLLLDSQINDKKSVDYLKFYFNEVYLDKVNTWDYQWAYAILRNNGLCILPVFNLISNIGFDESATHTLYSSPFANRITYSVLPIIHPASVFDNNKLTSWIASKLYRHPTFTQILWMKIKRRFMLAMKL